MAVYYQNLFNLCCKHVHTTQLFSSEIYVIFGHTKIYINTNYDSIFLICSTHFGNSVSSIALLGERERQEFSRDRGTECGNFFKGTWIYWVCSLCWLLLLTLAQYGIWCCFTILYRVEVGPQQRYRSKSNYCSKALCKAIDFPPRQSSYLLDKGINLYREV